MKKVVFVYEQFYNEFEVEIDAPEDFDRLYYRLDHLGHVSQSDAGTSIARFLQDGYSVDIRCAPREEDVLTRWPLATLG